jgi:hypothetical protein
LKNVPKLGEFRHIDTARHTAATGLNRAGMQTYWRSTNNLIVFDLEPKQSENKRNTAKWLQNKRTINAFLRG